MSVQYHVAHVDGWYRVYATTNGIDRHYVGPRFDTPRGAIDYAHALAGMPVTSPLRTTRDGDGSGQPSSSRVARRVSAPRDAGGLTQRTPGGNPTQSRRGPGMNGAQVGMDREMDMTRCGATIGKDRAEFGFVPRQCGQVIGIQPVLGVDGRMRFACLRWGHREDVVRQFGEMPDPMEPDWLEQADPVTAAKGWADR